MNRVFLVTLALFVTTLAGCSGGGGDTALSLRSEAESKARDLASDPTLVAVFAAEWTNESFGGEFRNETPEAAAMDQGTDPDPGDGHANAWAYLFRTGDQFVMVIVDAGGGILHSGTIDADSNTADSYGGTDPLTGIEVDSDEAADIVKENDEEYTSIIGQEDVVVVMALAQDDSYGGAFWVFTAFSNTGQDDEAFVFALVNAQTGEYVELPDFGGR